MAEAATKLPLKKAEAPTKAPAPAPWNPFAGLREEIDRLFDDFSFGWPALTVGRPRAEAMRSPFGEGASLQPAVEATENDKEYVISAELPGIDEKNVEVTLADGAISLRGEKTEEKDEKKDNYHVTERRYGSFERRFRLPEGVDTDKIEATMKKGVLKIVLPKSAEARKKTRKVAVKAK